jgi:hypothetical protein
LKYPEARAGLARYVTAWSTIDGYPEPGKVHAVLEDWFAKHNKFFECLDAVEQPVFLEDSTSEQAACGPHVKIVLPQQFDTDDADAYPQRAGEWPSAPRTGLPGKWSRLATSSNG